VESSGPRASHIPARNSNSPRSPCEPGETAPRVDSTAIDGASDGLIASGVAPNTRRLIADQCYFGLEARALHAAAFPYGAVSRAYHAVFHASRALLFSIGLEAKSHKAVVSMIGDHFIRSGRLSPQMGRLLSRLQRDREDADYATGAVFTAEEAGKVLAEAEAFVAEARQVTAAEKPTGQQ